jgi:integrase
MAVDRSQFVNVIEKGLKANKDYTKFYINFKKEGKGKQKVIDYTSKDWSKQTRLRQAKQELLNQQNKDISLDVKFNENSSLNIIADVYFSVQNNTTWTKKRIASYNLYCRNSIGYKKIKDVKTVNIDTLRKSMEAKGKVKRTQEGCKPRTIIQVLDKILKPILKYAFANDVITKVPEFTSPKIPKVDRKKKVTKATDKFITLYKTIMTLYKDDSFYRALFLFAWYSRRWNEIRTLKWTDIDFLDNSYVIRACNNKAEEDMTYHLPLVIAEALSHMDIDSGLVFKSPVTNKELFPPKRQLKHVRNHSGIQQLTMHYFRHIHASTMRDAGAADSIVSASIGHSENSTVLKTSYQTIDHQKSSAEVNATIGKILNKEQYNAK